MLTGLNEQQKQAVTHTGGPLLIIAGAGTGKTTVITQRIAWLIQEKGLKSDEILALTFTEKAATEMEERVENLLPLGFVDLWISTFHGFCERILQDHALDIGLPAPFKLYTEIEQWMLLRKHIEELDLNYYRPLGSPTKFLHALIKHFSRAKDEDITPQQYINFAQEKKLNTDTAEGKAATKHLDAAAAEKITEAERLNEIAGAYAKYQKFLLDDGALDFGDLITQTIRLFRERPFILEQIRKQFKYILVDEFQDTNYAQYDLIKLLAAPTNNLTIVADDDQSIYKFRGASVSNVLQFKEHYKDAKEISLVKNYRSKQNILDLAYNFIQKNNPDRLEEKLNINKRLESQSEGAGRIEHLHAQTLEGEAELVVKKILELQKNDPALNWGDYAILVRANDHAGIFMQMLEKARIPYQFLASKGLYLKPEIIDLLALLRLLDNYHEPRSAYRVLTMSIFAVPHEDIVKIINDAQKHTRSLFESMRTAQEKKDVSVRGREGMRKILDLIASHTQMTREHQPVGSVLLSLLEGSGLLRHITNTLTEEQAQAKARLLEQLFKNIEAFQKSSDTPTVQNFLEHVQLQMDAGDSGAMTPDMETGPDTVKIMTAHGSKGLEFRHCFVVNMVDKRFPGVGRKEAIALPDGLVKEVLPQGDAHIQEERRLFYVAITRAKDGVFFTSAEDYGGERKKKLSQFLIEAGVADEPKKQSQKLSRLEKSKTDVIKTHEYVFTPPRKFSYSELATYERCPYQYRFKYVLRIPVRASYNASFGTTLHATLEEFFQAMQAREAAPQGTLFSAPQKTEEKFTAPTLKELLEMFERHWLEEWYPTKKLIAEYKQKGLDFLRAFYHKHEGNWPKIKYLEKEFTVRIAGFAVHGFIDRVDDVGNNKVEIIDYKTGKSPLKPKKDNEQLMLYAIAMEDVFEHKPVRVSYYYTDINDKHSFAVNAKRLDEVKVWVLDLAQKIRSGDFTATPGHVCLSCEFREICDFRK